MSGGGLPRECSLETGMPKLRFDTRAEAKKAAAPWGHRVYRCRHCRYFHMASASAAPASSDAPPASSDLEVGTGAGSSTSTNDNGRGSNPGRVERRAG